MEFAPKPKVRTLSVVKSDDESTELDDILTSVREDLAELFLWWYGEPVASTVLRKSFNRQGRMILCTSTTESTIPDDDDISEQETEHCWRTKWYASESQQPDQASTAIDNYLGSRFGDLLDKDKKYYECVTTLQPDCLWETLAMIVLFDQVPRFIYRGTEQAALTDHKALHHALELVHTGMFQKLPLHFKAVIISSLCHSQDSDVHKILGDLITLDIERNYMRSHPVLAAALKQQYGSLMEDA